MLILSSGEENPLKEDRMKTGSRYQLNTWKYGLNPPTKSFAHIRNNGKVFQVTSVQRIIRIKKQDPLFRDLELPENVGFNICIQEFNLRNRSMHAIISTDFKPENED